MTDDAERYRYLRARLRQKQADPSLVFLKLPTVELQRNRPLADRIDAAIDAQLAEAAWQDSLRVSK